jgi:hypothetical protein
VFAAHVAGAAAPVSAGSRVEAEVARVKNRTRTNIGASRFEKIVGAAYSEVDATGSQPGHRGHRRRESVHRGAGEFSIDL